LLNLRSMILTTTGTTGRNSPLPEQRDKPLVTQDSELVVKIRTSGSDTVDADDSELRLPVSEYEV